MANEIQTTEGKSRNPIVVDLGKHKKKQIKRLRKGKGGLMDDVGELLTELKQNGVVDEGAQPIIVVVREKADKMRWFR